MKKTNDKDLVRMVDELKMLPQLYRPSPTWEELNVFHNEQLTKYGLDNLKRSVNRTYFNWGVLGFFLQHLPFTFSEIIRGNLKPIIKSEYVEKGSVSRKYNELEIGGKYIIINTQFRICFSKHFIRQEREHELKIFYFML